MSWKFAIGFAWLSATFFAAHSGSAAPSPEAANGPGPESGSDSDSAGDRDFVAAPAKVVDLKRQLERDMTTLGRLANRAADEADLVRAACVLDKYERGQSVMEVATSEVLVVQDPASTERQRQFAAEKLGAAAVRLQSLADEARQCAGETSPEDQDDVTSTELDEAPTVPVVNPTVGGATPPVPPSVNDQRPPTTASPTQ
jgi:hypothetical protein